MSQYDKILRWKLEEIRKKVATDPEIRKRKERLILQLSRLSYEQLHRMLLLSHDPLDHFDLEE